LGKRASFSACDIADTGSVTALFADIQTRYGPLQHAVNCAASEARIAALHDIGETEARQLIDIDVLGVLRCMQAEVAAMRAANGGTIVNVSSINGLSGTAQAALYSAGRHAVVGLTRSAALEYIGEGIRINAVCPGAIDTPRRQRRMQALPPEQAEAQQAALARSIPIGRLGQADEIAAAIVWLSSEASSYVVGHSLVVDGGLVGG
jgi:NAD(P)-dependent dehydrogenase (short-subunit alcohol dehydrogenase family)